MGWVLHFSNSFLGQKLLDREGLARWSIVMVENSRFGPMFRPFSQLNSMMQDIL
jgi:hypothetical protein